MPYQIKTPTWLVKDETSIKFHVANDDYFGTMATLLDLLKQAIYKPQPDTKKIKAAFENMEKDFMWLQENYKISSK
ncbi:hypothetical protein COT98_02535 [Candidatus Falkowbacteria bacterium CG10_big_fil_rev_8_21_14_0_10_39_9]|uniref:Uncharacterized protein n=1 Tax=Candidatus Falkowbacteria bacterium CG10_big_fil_rev_8_21_14_0_10_39_9 TaxID=1974566 RepID=A0A2M6WPH3_9BACT|nr:MAG: hypothetical protein COT98_02535 [Candidatus Falkowbacteria bacterium CG10_big_fil_rev_8_21_14_0_10_39_9]